MMFNTPSLSLKHILAISASALLLNACGGGSSSSTPAATTPPPPVTSGNSDPQFRAGVFEDEDNFVARCENPRTGTDPSTDRPFVDVAGSELEEKFWLRSWSNRTYLWYDEITDIDPNTVAGREAYFATLRTEAVTPSGAPRDQFHFTQDTAERFERVSTGSSSSFGSQYAIIESSPPRDIRIAFTQPGSPFGEANILRGAKILEIDDVDAVNGGTQADVDVLNNALFPSEPGQTHTFVIEDTAGAEPRTVTVSSETVVFDPVLRSSIIEQDGDQVGYVVFNTFGSSTAEEQLFDTFEELSDAGVDDLVLDLRYNGGGFLAIAAQLGYMIAGTNTRNQTFETLQFNDKFPEFDPVTGERITPTPFYDTTLGFTLPSGRDLPSVNLNRIFVLSTGGSCSASEALINGLQGIDVEVVLIGDTTCGKPYGFYTTDNCGLSYSTIQFRGVNSKGFGDYADGFSPGQTGDNVRGELVNGCAVPDDFSAQLGDEDEDLLQSALSFRETGVCPDLTGAQARTLASRQARGLSQGLSLESSPIYQREMSYRQSLLRDTPPSLVQESQ